METALSVRFNRNELFGETYHGGISGRYLPDAAERVLICEPIQRRDSLQPMAMKWSEQRERCSERERFRGVMISPMARGAFAQMCSDKLANGFDELGGPDLEAVGQF